MDTWQAMDEEPSALADDLATLNDAQWGAQSLCTEWRVRHVVGHLVGGVGREDGPISGRDGQEPDELQPVHGP